MLLEISLISRSVSIAYSVTFYGEKILEVAVDMSELSLRDIQIGSLEILKKVSEICAEQHLTYYLAYGTLIGAVRHKGFIPWDDDIDLWMPRDDYEKLINYFMCNESGLFPFKLFSIYNNADYPYEISRISDVRYKLVVDNEKPYGIGLFVDVYPLDGVGNSPKEYTKLKNRASKLSSLCYLSTRMKYEKGSTKGRLKQAIKLPAFIFSKLMGKEYWVSSLEKMAKCCNYEDSDYIGSLVWGHDGIKAIFPKTWFEGVSEVMFEGQVYSAPKHYHEVLKRLYGDYMALPPENKRVAHHNYKAYRRENI